MPCRCKVIHRWPGSRFRGFLAFRKAPRGQYYRYQWSTKWAVLFCHNKTSILRILWFVRRIIGCRAFKTTLRSIQLVQKRAISQRLLMRRNRKRRIPKISTQSPKLWWSTWIFRTAVILINQVQNTQKCSRGSHLTLAKRIPPRGTRRLIWSRVARSQRLVRKGPRRLRRGKSRRVKGGTRSWSPIWVTRTATIRSRARSLSLRGLRGASELALLVLAPHACRWIRSSSARLSWSRPQRDLMKSTWLSLRYPQCPMPVLLWARASASTVAAATLATKVATRTKKWSTNCTRSYTSQSLRRRTGWRQRAVSLSTRTCSTGSLYSIRMPTRAWELESRYWSTSVKQLKMMMLAALMSQLSKCNNMCQTISLPRTRTNSTVIFRHLSAKASWRPRHLEMSLWIPRRGYWAIGQGKKPSPLWVIYRIYTWILRASRKR